jgi:hypothetical protein
LYPVAQRYRLQIGGSGQGNGTGLLAQLHADACQLALDDATSRLAELTRHDPGMALQQRDIRAPSRQPSRRFHAQNATANHHARSPQSPVQNGLGIRRGAQGEHPVQIRAVERGNERVRPHGQHQTRVGDVLARAERDRLRLAVDALHATA